MNAQADLRHSDLSRLTIVVPSYERPQYLARQIRYWNDRQVALLIVDGSARPLESAQTSGNSRLLYHHHVASFQHRMLRACELITTEFVALCGDDDLYLPSGLRACIQRLDQDSGMVGCVGRSLRFSRKRGDLFAQFINRDVADTSKKFASGLSASPIHTNRTRLLMRCMACIELRPGRIPYRARTHLVLRLPTSTNLFCCCFYPFVAR